LSLFRATDKEASMKLETYAQLGQIFSKLSARNAWSSFYSSKGICSSCYGGPPTYNVQGLVLTFPIAQAPLNSTSQPSIQKSFLDANPYECCPDQISLGFGSFGIRQRFSLNIDVASSVTAYALNFGIIDTDRLTKVHSSSGHDDEGPLEINGWVDDNHPGMDTVYCFSGKLRRVCVPKYGRYSYAFPVIATMKVNRTNRHYNLETCECSRDKWSSGMFGCNIGTSFILALLFSNDQYEESAIQKGTHKMFNNMVNFKNLVMNLLLNEDYQMIGEKIGPGVSIFMTVLDYPGSIASINPQGVKVTQFAVPSLPRFNITNFSGSNTSYPFVMCQNLFVHPAALEQMANNPPVTMEQPYFECTPTNATAFFTAAGIATANSATVSAIFLGLAVTLAIHYFNRSHKEAKILPPAEKALLAEQLSQHLLVENNLLHSRLDEMTANMIALSSELASIKTALPKQQHNNSTESPQLATLSFARPLSTLARPSTDEIPDSAYCENPLHSQKAAKKFDPIVQELHGRL
jgi:hypothetical protein